jgi:hypothetical protein
MLPDAAIATANGSQTPTKNRIGLTTLATGRTRVDKVGKIGNSARTSVTSSHRRLPLTATVGNRRAFSYVSIRGRLSSRESSEYDRSAFQLSRQAIQNHFDLLPSDD